MGCNLWENSVEQLVKEKMRLEAEVADLKTKITDLENQLRWAGREKEKLKEKISTVANIVCEKRIRFWKR